MSDVININEHMGSVQAKAAASDHTDDAQLHDEFLLNEGLDLIAYFRAIKNQAVRSSIRDLVRELATTKA